MKCKQEEKQSLAQPQAPVLAGATQLECCRAQFECPGGHQVEQTSAMCPCCKEGEWSWAALDEVLPPCQGRESLPSTEH